LLISAPFVCFTLQLYNLDFTTQRLGARGLKHRLEHLFTFNCLRGLSFPLFFAHTHWRRNILVSVKVELAKDEIFLSLSPSLNVGGGPLDTVVSNSVLEVFIVIDNRLS
jgi:hypothetical protein